jgi:hypothetical protein
MAKILINYPTRSRPHKFMQVMQDYVSKASGFHELQFFVKIDKDDTSMNNQRIVDFLNKMKINYVLQVLDDCKGKIDAINRGVERYEFDFLVSIADDMLVVENGWDDTMAVDMLREFPEYDGALNYNTDSRLETAADGRPEGWKGLITLPVIGRKLYRRFGYIYHPDYISESCDDEQTIVYTALNVLRHIDRRPIVHDFVPWHDPLMVKNMQIGQTVDRATFVARKAKNFDLPTP